MAREIIGASLILLVAVVGLFIYRSVGRRRKLQEVTMPDYESRDLQEPLFSCLYVATVFVDRPLERVWAYGLGGRGRAILGLSDEDLVIDRIGERSLTIPLASIRGVIRGGATIDRGVEKSGLVQIKWTLGTALLLTSIRITANQEGNYLKLKEVIGA